MSSPAHKTPDEKALYRPTSPHLQVWHWHITMFSSIVHRASGVAMVAGLIMLAAWFISITLGREAYTVFLTYAASPYGIMVWVGLSLAGFVHMAGGIRHLIWDLGLGFEPKTANNLSFLSLVGAVLTTVALWAYLFVSGKVVL